MSYASFSSVNLCVGDGWQTYCHTYADTTPILGVAAGPSHVSISLRGRNADESAVEFARALADEARKFAAEVERMHAAQLDGDGVDKAAGDSAA
jgi:hypothetical protein